jgi:hypothetical protein
MRSDLYVPTSDVEARAVLAEGCAKAVVGLAEAAEWWATHKVHLDGEIWRNVQTRIVTAENELRGAYYELTGAEL